MSETKKEETHYKYTKKGKIACGLLSRKRKSSFVAFVENDNDDEDDNQNLSGSKLILTWSEIPDVLDSPSLRMN